jgi:hypothetical protein
MIPAHVRFLTGTPCNAHSHSNHRIHARQVDFAAALSVKNIAVMSLASGYGGRGRIKRQGREGRGP